MEEIAQQFKEELQELLDRYKDRLTTPQIMRIAQPIFTKTIGFKDNPELNVVRYVAHNLTEKDLQGEFKYIEYKPGDEPNAFSGPNPICSQGPDGTCATYKNGWNACKGCAMYHGGKRCID